MVWPSSCNQRQVSAGAANTFGSSGDLGGTDSCALPSGWASHCQGLSGVKVWVCCLLQVSRVW